MSWLAESKNASERGFALPTILIASIVMLMVLLSSVQTAVSVNTAIDNQYYNKLAQVAAESGAAVVQSCLKQSQAGEAVWSTNVSTLTPAMDCEGVVVNGASPYVLDTALVKSTFAAKVVASSSTGLPTQVSVEGSVSRHRQSNGNAWKGYTTSLAIQLDRNSVTINNLSSGVEATCASVGGKAYCWGNQANGRLGNLATTGIALSPQPVVEEQNLLQGRKVTQISVGYGSVCAIAALPESTTGGRAYCWGDNSQGQLGNGTITGSAKPVAVTVGSSGLPNTETVTSIAAGRGYACAVATARVYCWGSNSSGQLGIGTATDVTANRNPRIITSTLTNAVKEVYAGSGTKTTCALRTATVDNLYCWGNNSKGQTGRAASAAVVVPTIVNGGGLGSGTTTKILNASVGGPNNGSGITSPDSDEDGYVCAVKANTMTSIEGIGYCWGSNNRGAIGAGPTVADGSNVTAPTEILNSTFVSDGVNYGNYAKNTASTALGTIQKIVTGWGTSCAIRTTIGSGSTITTGANPSPDPYHSGTSTNKAIICWGTNELSNLALNDASASKANIMNEWTSGPVYAPPGNFDGTTSIFGLRVPRHIPPFMPNSALHMSGITDLYGGGHRMCVVTGGRLYCWGNNAAGQVGSSQTTESRVAWPILADLVENLKGSYLY